LQRLATRFPFLLQVAKFALYRLIRIVDMFTNLRPESEKRTLASMGLSVVIHFVLLGVALYRPTATFVKPTSVRAGQYGTSLTPIYFTKRGSDAGGDQKQTESLKRASLEFRKKRSRSRRNPVQQSRDTSQTMTVAHADSGTTQQAASAGSPYGSLWEGSATGFEIKPALPVVGPQPQVYTSNLPRGFEGDVIVEITIDEQGNITNRALVHGVGNGLDEQAISVLQSWRFRPATRDGVAIPSKQDVYFHFVGTRS
jgi:TonB family protein